MLMSSSASSSEEQTLMRIQNEESTRSLISQENKDFTHIWHDQQVRHLQAAQWSEQTTASPDVSDSSFSMFNFPSNAVMVDLPEHAVQWTVDSEWEEYQYDDLDWVDISKKLAFPDYGMLPGSPSFSSNSEMGMMYPATIYSTNSEDHSDDHYEIPAEFLTRNSIENQCSVAGLEFEWDGVSNGGNCVAFRDEHFSCQEYFNKAVEPPLGDSEADYLFSDQLIRKRKFRLMINTEMENKLKEEFREHAHNLTQMIILKYQSLNLFVEVKAYRRQDKNVDKTTNLKAFNIIFDGYGDAKTALDLTKTGELNFKMKEARPSPKYFVKYIVMYEVCVYLGKCFSKPVCHLKKGDIVTANQLKGNKLRIIRCRRSGMDRDIHGWVLLQTKEREHLRRIDYVDGEIIMTENRPNFETIMPKEQQIIHPSKCTTQRTNPRRVSAARCSPFRVLTYVEVCKGRKEPTVVDVLKPNSVVWANQHKGSMLRIVKMDRAGRIKFDHDQKPEPWGWVSLRKKGEDKPRLERMFNKGASIKTSRKSLHNNEKKQSPRSFNLSSDTVPSSINGMNIADSSFSGSPKTDNIYEELMWPNSVPGWATIDEDQLRMTLMSDSASPSSFRTVL